MRFLPSILRGAGPPAKGTGRSQLSGPADENGRPCYAARRRRRVRITAAGMIAAEAAVAVALAFTASR